MASTTPVFKASRKELWSALSNANLTDGITWKQSSRELMITIAVKNDIEDVPCIGENDVLLKKLSKTFTPSFFKSIKDLEQLFNTMSETSDVEAETEAESTDHPLVAALKKN